MSIAWIGVGEEFPGFFSRIGPGFLSGFLPPPGDHEVLGVERGDSGIKGRVVSCVLCLVSTVCG